MAFSEAIKLEVKRRAHFQCVVCKTPYFVEVHHIVPQSEGGGDDLDNAASLCPSCHDWFGANAEKRKAIRQMRNFHYELCERNAAGPAITSTFERLDRLQAEMSAQRQDQAKMSEALHEIKLTLVNSFTERAQAISAASTLAEVIQASTGVAIQGTGTMFTPLGGMTDIGRRCERCGSTVYFGGQFCPSCGAPLG